MQDVKHTPEPWLMTCDAAGERGVRSKRGFICFLPKPFHYSGQDERYDEEKKMNEADACLIASVPALLRENQTFLKALRTVRDWHEMRLLPFQEKYGAGLDILEVVVDALKATDQSQPDEEEEEA